MDITFVTHSCFVAETAKSVLIFDYFKGELPEADAGKTVYFFASHKHGDHYSPEIFTYAKRWEQVRYILSRDIRPRWKDYPEELRQCVTILGKDQEMEFPDLKVRTLRSTDQGVAFIVETEGKRIYHAGDLNWWHWEGDAPGENRQMELNYKKELDKIRGEHFDVAFLPVDPRLEEAYYFGAKAFLEAAEAKIVFPMHFWGDYSVCRRLKEEPAMKVFSDCIAEVEKENQQWRFKNEGDRK